MAFILAVVGGFINKYAGDAARYLNSSPDNIAERQLIKKDGIEILRRLHEMKDRKGKDKYERIIVVGHSLGSVIGYDIIKHFWVEFNKNLHFKREAKVEETNLETEKETKANERNDSTLQELEKFGETLCKQFALYNDNDNDNDNEDENFDNKKVEAANLEFQKLQEQLLKEQTSEKTPWKISDFITLGSPLTYADFLLSKNREEFEERALQRELPVCPPTDSNFDQQNTTKRKYTYASQKEEFENLHHAAVFAITRWTNIYYKGDLIGGKLGSLFGFGIKDIEAKIQDTKLHEKRLSHIKYWDSFKNKKNEALQELKKIILFQKQ